MEHNKHYILEVLKENIQFLDQCPKHDWAKHFVNLKMKFFKLCQSELVFSTRFGADFFKDVLYHVSTGTPLTPEKGKQLGEYDLNFNMWLKKL